MDNREEILDAEMMKILSTEDFEQFKESKHHRITQAIYAAMQQYAEQEAVGFNNWLYKSEYHYDNDGWYRIDEVGFKRYSLEELYAAIYLQSKIK